MKSIILAGATIGSIVGAYAPNLWGDDNGFGMAALALSTVGAIFGIWAGYKLAQRMEI